MIITERGWRCLNIGCPTREPVRADTPPKCYTCDRPMAEVRYPVTEKEIGRLAAEIEASAPEFEPSQRLITELEEYRSPPEDSPELASWSYEQLTRWREARRLWKASDAARVRGERVHREVERYLRERPLSNPFPYGYDVVGEETGRATVSVGYEVETEPAYRCTRAGCPEREAVSASSPPTCYTCQQPMTAVAEFARPMVEGLGEVVEAFQRRIAAAIAVCERAVMTDLRVACSGPYAWNVTVKFQEIRTAVRYEHTIALLDAEPE